GKRKSFKCIFVDTSFLKTFNIPIVKGRDFLPGDLGRSCMFNEAAYKYMEFKDLDGKRFNNGRPGGYEVVGVVKNFNFASLHEEVSPMCLMLVDVPTSTFSIKIAKGKVGAVMESLKKIWEETLTEYPLKYEFFDERFDSMYRKAEKFGELIGLFSMLAIVISCMGILGLAVFSSERRTKEIGIRKVHGASIPELMYMLNKDFIKWVLIAFVIAAPVGYYFMQNWLEDFAYKTSIDWTVFILSGFFALAVALFTINWQIWRSATRNPVEVLKYE
ncbi:MAG TPA: FtsX-like permease family protein, partial [Ignavibacteriales bacterium]|nr:FtsX-like permease family protein [Ignavibacteriales bacterium]